LNLPSVPTTVVHYRHREGTPPPSAMPQDMPPEGGYQAVQYKRNIPARGFRPSFYLFGMAAVMTFGFWQYGKGVRERNELAREKIWARIHLTPVLQAEEDRDLVRRMMADYAREKQLLGKTTQVYNSDRIVRPTYAMTPRDVTK